MIVPREMQGSADVALHYDELDWVYRAIWGEHVHHGLWTSGRESSDEAVEALCARVAERLDPQAGAELCDIGCGYGGTAAWIAARHDVAVTGFTLSREQERIASAHPGKLRFQRRDWLDNGLADARFDGAYAIESTEHMADKQRFFDEAARVLRPGGRLVVCAWLAAPQPSRWEVDHLLEPICREGRLPGMGSADEYRAMAERAGFATRSYEDLSDRVARTWTICAVRLARRFATDARLRRLVFDRTASSRVFLLSVPRLILAYRTGAMRYGLFTFERSAA